MVHATSLGIYVNPPVYCVRYTFTVPSPLKYRYSLGSVRPTSIGKAVDYEIVHYCVLICTALSRTSLSMTRPGSR